MKSSPRWTWAFILQCSALNSAALAVFEFVNDIEDRRYSTQPSGVPSSKSWATQESSQEAPWPGAALIITRPYCRPNTTQNHNA